MIPSYRSFLSGARLHASFNLEYKYSFPGSDNMQIIPFDDLKDTTKTDMRQVYEAKALMEGINTLKKGKPSTAKKL